MRILHIWNQAGVSSILAKYQNKLGHYSEVIKRDGFDLYGIEKYYGSTIYKGSSAGFYLYARKRSKDFDIVHVHSQVKIIPILTKPTILHFHGSDIRKAGFVGRIENWICSKLSDKVLVSTPDLLNVFPSAEWIPTPIDTELFNKNIKGKKFSSSIISYKDMPNYLRLKRVYVQKVDKVWALSKLSLEALSCGVSVKWNGLIIKGKLPNHHKPMNVCKRTLEIYEKILHK